MMVWICEHICPLGNMSVQKHVPDTAFDCIQMKVTSLKHIACGHDTAPDIHYAGYSLRWMAWRRMFCCLRPSAYLHLRPACICRSSSTSQMSNPVSSLRRDHPVLQSPSAVASFKTSFSSLPNEVVHEIFQYLMVNVGLYEAVRLRQVNRESDPSHP
jgi:hypothetical protein